MFIALESGILIVSMNTNDSPTSRTKVLSIVSAASLATVAICSGILWVLGNRELNAENQYDFFLTTMVLLLILLASVLANAVMFFVTALGSDKAASTSGRILLLVLCGMHLLVSAYFILGYATGNTFLTN